MTSVTSESALLRLKFREASRGIHLLLWSLKRQVSLCKKGLVDAELVIEWLETAGGQALELKDINRRYRLFRRGFGRRIDRVVKRFTLLHWQVEEIIR